MHQSDIAKLLAALVVFLVVAFAVTGNGPWVLLGALVALAFAAWWFLEQRRRSSTSTPTRTSDNDSTSRTSRTERPVVAGRDGGAEKPTVERPTGSGSDKRTAPREVSGQDRLSPLRSQLPHIPNMSGAAFERYMANVFKALGYNARVLGGAGDQGVDLLLQKGSERIAVQCKNLRRPVGNPPVQQVLAGKLYHKTDRAWVVAPAGYTDGARALARRTDVVLFDRRSIEKLIQQAEHHAAEELRSSPEPVVAPHSEQGKKDRANYTRLLKLYEDNLALLEQARAARAPHEGDPSVEQKFRETWNKICGNLEKPMGIFEKLDILERRNTDMERERKKRAELQARQQLIESNLSTVESPKQVPEASTSPETPATNTSSTRNHLVGETAITMSGDRLTVHSYESPVAPLPYMQPEEDYEFVALDVEWCTSPNSRTTLIEAHPTRFNLHMPDNTRLPRHARQFKEPVLHSTRLEPGDCVRGWVTFKKPKGVKPRYIMYTDGRSLLKWRIQ